MKRKVSIGKFFQYYSSADFVNNDTSLFALSKNKSKKSK